VDVLKEIANFIMERVGIEGASILLLSLALIYVWFQHHRLKLLEERLSLVEEKRKAVAQELERVSRSQDEIKAQSVSAALDEEIGANTVIIADDEQMMVSFLTFILQEELKGISVIGVSDGVEALHQIERRSPSLLILDLMMPRKTGFDVLKELSRRAEKLPVLVVSAYASSKKEVAERAEIESERIEFLVKPFDPNELLSMVRKLMSVKSKAG